MSSGQPSRDKPTGATGRTRAAASGLRKPTVTTVKKPYAPPSFLGMFELPPDSSDRVKAVVRRRDND